jgi:hypothetical protein
MNAFSGIPIKGSSPDSAMPRNTTHNSLSEENRLYQKTGQTRKVNGLLLIVD